MLSQTGLNICLGQMNSVFHSLISCITSHHRSLSGALNMVALYALRTLSIRFSGPRLFGRVLQANSNTPFCTHVCLVALAKRRQCWLTTQTNLTARALCAQVRTHHISTCRGAPPRVVWLLRRKQLIPCHLPEPLPMLSFSHAATVVSDRCHQLRTMCSHCLSTH